MSFIGQLKLFLAARKNRLQLALNLKRSGDIWIFDEPTNDLDLETLQILEEKLSEFKGALILISHDRSFLSNVTNKIWLIENQKIETFEGGYGQVGHYLDARDLEKRLEAKNKPKNQKALKVAVKEETKQIPLSNKEKNRLKKVEQEISEAETKLENITTRMEAFDFAKMDQEASTKI